MNNPKDVFEKPFDYWEFITSPTDDEFESQTFDRKAAGLPNSNKELSKAELKNLKKQITECISAFANANREGGLLVVGVGTNGEIEGIDHLSEDQLNSITNFNVLLRNQTATTHIEYCKNSDDRPCKILLIYTPFSKNGICETLGNTPKAWVRSGPQNLPMIGDMKDQIKRDKRIVEFERSYCCPFDLSDVDQDVLREFKKYYLEKSSYDLSDEEILYESGIIQKLDGEYVFTNAGFLFIAKNPRRILPWAYIRLLRYEGIANESSPGLTTLDKEFEGPIPQQIRKIRSFFKSSGFFKTYQTRKTNGGFIDEPEFPFLAVDEAIVNAVAHRDYGIQLPVVCEHFKDAFTVVNPGPVLQRDKSLPVNFTLDITPLSSLPRNSLLIEWLKVMRDENGSAFVRALSEGTRKMNSEMTKADLPSPTYNLHPFGTKVSLYNNIIEREAVMKAASTALNSTEFINLYKIELFSDGKNKPDIKNLAGRRKEIMNSFRDILEAKGWFINRYSFSRLVAHRKGISISLQPEISSTIGLYPSYVFQLREYYNVLYLVVDYILTVKNIKTVNALLKDIPPDDLINRYAVCDFNGWTKGKILSADNEFTKVFLFSYDFEEYIPNNKVIPDLSTKYMKDYIKDQGYRFDLSKEIKKHSLSLMSGAGRVRHEKTIITVKQLSKDIFPISLGDVKLFLNDQPEPLERNENKGNLNLKNLPEPLVEFNHHKESPDIRNGITRFGAYQDSRKTIELVPICQTNLQKSMSSLIERLKTGKFRYTGSEKTFSTKLIHNAIITVQSPHDIFSECKRLIDEHPQWSGNSNFDRLFLVHTPELGFALDDENSPYYRVKRLLLETGIPCQMVDTPTILNPDWKDLNLTLNIISKCGITPWVLPDKIPDADFFVGLSYTQSRKKGAQKLLGYATVFNEFGRWEFYAGNTNTFSYEDRRKYFAELTKKTLVRLPLSENPSIYFHYSARFSKEDRTAILSAARSVKPNGTYSFVWVNSHHDIRLYDSRPETDGSLSRGSYVKTSNNQILLSTTGYNPYRKALGTPKPLEITIRIEKPDGKMEFNPDLKSLAVQILSLTKLNWASTDSVSGEPITTKYAGSIAYLTDAFLRQSDSFKLHPVLESTPWFL